MARDMGVPTTPLSRGSFDSTAAEKRVAGLFKTSSLAAFGNFTRPEIGALVMSLSTVIVVVNAMMLKKIEL